MMTFADKIEMQNRLFAELSDMFGREVPLYDKALLVNKACNKNSMRAAGAVACGFQHFGRATGQDERRAARGDTDREAVGVSVGGGIFLRRSDWSLTIITT